ncbi:VCBS repeat-containing protein [Croceivirga sp. JEA036]|uniref:VCBS repeat-containing protein n=1 Tax=Croceivirga sp. JEA036 TaxID=2721162 RepID=UPI001438F961|nr:VCBS repeat-containing protein [Croceivirga sp. JEA036]NJB35207.1 VCBS repeat-containing protein [Croceivirga sp. JEA036]
MPSFSFLNKIFSFLFCGLLLVSCKKDKEEQLATLESKYKLFSNLDATETGIDFINTLEETLEANYFQYMYTYIGGGVAAGDINDDGFVDLYFTSNSGPDKFYLNLGGMQFRDITSTAGIDSNDGFNTGVTMVDINNDGLLDIYVSRGGWKAEDNKFANLLYINNGDLTFTEKAKEHGLADANRSIQATFFDYDKDNDLDVYIANTPDITGRTKILDLDQVESDPETKKLLGSDRLYQNDGTGHFTDVSEKAGLRIDLGFGLNPQVGDLNSDGWPDIYVCNDFNVPDLAYVNNGDGTFTESRDQLFKHMSFNSMGSDMADVNNDGFLDLLTLDMNPEDYIRSKTTMAMTSIASFEEMVAQGYHYQYMHNMLQLNNGNGSFREISKMAGIANTDWSWSILSADFDLDGFNDVFVTNGVYRDVIDQDKNREILRELKKNNRKPTKEDFLRYAQLLPQQKLKNYFFRNKGDLTFEATTEEWATMEPSFSNGALYADLDNDGDLDIVVNNINNKATVLRNNITNKFRKRTYHLKIDLIGPEHNRFGIGTKVNLYFKDGTQQSREMVTTRGFLSSVPTTLHFGLANHLKVQKMEVIWPDGKVQVLTDVNANQSLLLNYRFAKPVSSETTLGKKWLQEVPFAHQHIEDYFNDYSAQLLLPHKLSQTGKAIAVADINKDGLDDVYLGGGYNQAGQLLMGNKEGTFTTVTIPSFTKDAPHEDQDALFFDADNDGDLDLYVVSGSYEFINVPHLAQDRLYINQGNNAFVRAEANIPKEYSSGSTVTAHDFDEDGDLDLFVGGRVIPGKYPYAPKSSILLNENGFFKDITASIAPDLENLGMVTDAQWADFNGDGKKELLVTGEWLGLHVFECKGGLLKPSDSYKDLVNQTGWWNKLLVTDIDADGDVDIVAGNLGLNYKFHASEEEPFHVYTNDFDNNGIEDIILSKIYDGKAVPIRGKTCMTQQLPHLEQKIVSYKDFANSDLEGILGKGVSSSLHYQVTEFRSGIFYNQGEGKFVFTPFQNELQSFPINSVLHVDVNSDGHLDLVVAGNNYMAEVETTRADAGIGAILKGDGKGGYTLTSHLKTGFFASKDVRNLRVLTAGQEQSILVYNNNARHQRYKMVQ